MRRLRKQADWLLLFAVNVGAFWILASPLLERGRAYDDNVRLFSVFRDSLNAVNRFGELMLWNPEYTFGFPAYYFAHLWTNTFSPLSTIVLFLAWLAGLLGIRIDDYTSLYIVYVHLAVPLLLSVSFYAFARQIVRHPAARAYLIVVSAFSPVVVFNYSGNGPEQTAYAFLAAAAFLKFYRNPSGRTFSIMVLATGACVAALNHLALPWSVAFLLLFILVTIVVDRRREWPRRAWKSVPAPGWSAAGLLLASYLLWPAATYFSGGEIVRSTPGTQVNDSRSLLAGNLIEALSASTPGVGFERRPREGSNQTDWAVVTYPGQRFGYTYLGALTLALTLLGLTLGRPPWRIRLVVLFASCCLLLPLAGATFRGASFLFLLSAGLGLEALLRPRVRLKAALALVPLFSISTVFGAVALFRIYPRTASVPVVSSFYMMSILYFVVVGWLLAPRAKPRHVLAAMAAVALIDVSTFATLHMRYAVWPLAEGPLAPAGASLSLAPDGPGRQYADGLLTLKDRAELEKAGLDAIRLKELPTYALYEHTVSATPADVEVPLDLFTYLVLPDPTSAGSTEPGKWTPGRWQSVKALHGTYNSFLFETETDREMYLFLRNSFFPGWSASIRRLGEDVSAAAGSDWVETPVYKAFWMFMAVRVPAGKSEVLFHFRPRLFVPLFLWTYLSLLALALLSFPCVISKLNQSS